MKSAIPREVSKRFAAFYIIVPGGLIAGKKFAGNKSNGCESEA
jgi:hypothetical protein